MPSSTSCAHRYVWMLVAIACVPCAAFAAPPQTAELVRAVRQATVGLPQAQRKAAETRAEKAFALTNIEFRTTESFAAITFSVNGAPEYRVFPLQDPHKIVVDLYDTVALSVDPEKVTQDHPEIKRLRMSLFETEPRLITRLVVELAEPYSYCVEKHEDGLQLVLSKKEAIAANGGQNTDRRDASNSHGTETSPKAEINALTEQLASLVIAPSADALGPATPTAPSSLEVVSAQLAAVQAAPISLPMHQGMTDAADAPSETSGSSTQNSTAQPETSTPQAGSSPSEHPQAAPEPPTKPKPTETEVPVEEAQTVEEPATAPQPRDTTAPAVTEANTAIATQLHRLAVEEQEQALAAPGTTPQQSPATAPKEPPRKKFVGDPWLQTVNIDFREMELANVVAILAHKAGVNVVAGADLTGTVTANLHDITLRQAMETVLRLNGLGLLEEEGVYHIVPYNEAVAFQRETEIIKLENAKASDLRKVLQESLRGAPYEKQVTFAANDATNLLVISGPAKRLPQIVAMARQMDVAEPVLPTVTEAIQLNYSKPSELVETVSKVLTPSIGKAAADDRARHLIITDVPAAIEQVRQLVKQLDIAVKQVAIETMVVDVTLDDRAETGVDWLFNVLRRQSRRDAALGNDVFVSDLQRLDMGTNLGLGPQSAGILNFGILTDRIDWRGLIQAEVRNQNGDLVSNPVVVTVENKPAQIQISSEVPYTDIQQTSQGGTQTVTKFKDIGTLLTVTPQVTHDNHIIAEMDVKESNLAGEFQGVPIEAKRAVKTTLNLDSGQTIFMGGLRKSNRDATVRKVPVLGDVPVFNVLFRQNVRNEKVNELLVFLTCRVIDTKEPLTARQEEKLSEGQRREVKVDAQGALFHDMFYPAEMRDPIWKYRRSQRSETPSAETK